jgi:hypothetical protein
VIFSALLSGISRMTASRGPVGAVAPRRPHRCHRRNAAVT